MGVLLEARGFRVTLQKFDPYLNVDPGTMSPFQHGEVYVTDDGAETDLDLGHYERFTSTITGKANSVTTGQVYLSVIEKERRGDFLGKTVQVIPHITDEIKDCIRRVAGDNDVVLVEIGGTVGDIESLPFLEAIRQFRQDVGRGNAINIHLTLVPPSPRPTSRRRSPRSTPSRSCSPSESSPTSSFAGHRSIPEEMKKKIALFCSVDERAVITARDVPSIYEVPLAFAREGLDEILLDYLSLPHYDRDSQAGVDREPRQEPPGRGHDRVRGQIRAARRQRQVPERGAPPRRDREQREGQDLVRGFRGTWRRPAFPRRSPARTRSSWDPASAGAASKAS